MPRMCGSARASAVVVTCWPASQSDSAEVSSPCHSLERQLAAEACGALHVAPDAHCLQTEEKKVRKKLQAGKYMVLETRKDGTKLTSRAFREAAESLQSISRAYDDKQHQLVDEVCTVFPCTCTMPRSHTGHMIGVTAPRLFELIPLYHRRMCLALQLASRGSPDSCRTLLYA